MTYKLVIEDDPGWMGKPSRGAGMGRPDTLPEDRTVAVKLHLTEMRMVDYDYDTGGAYWGCWSREHGGMYCAESTEGEYARIFIRDRNHDGAKQQVLKLLPNATFYT